MSLHFVAIVCLFEDASDVNVAHLLLLDNPNMADEKRMTLEQFIRNNRGINDGADLPVDFLTDLYYEIKVSFLLTCDHVDEFRSIRVRSAELGWLPTNRLRLAGLAITRLRSSWLANHSARRPAITWLSSAWLANKLCRGQLGLQFSQLKL